MTVLLDTNILIDLLNNRAGRREALADLASRDIKLASCAITVAEVYAGMRPKESGITAAVLAELEYFELTVSAAKRGGELKALWAKKGHTLSITDTLIAAVAIENGLSIATDNIKDFPMPEIMLLPLPRIH